MRIAVFTLTRDRLEYTKRSFASLQEKAGHPYDHFVLDNGSEDGTPDWLAEWATTKWSADPGYPKRRVIFMPENVGIAIGANMCLNEIADGNYDLVVKMDNDCLVISDNILHQIVEIFEDMKAHGPTWILSPRVEGINNQQRRVRFNMLAGRRIGITSMVGGLFLCAPASVWKDYRFPTDLPRARGADSHLCDWLRSRGGETGYIEGLVVEHMDGTDAQAKRFPEYWIRKRREESEPFDGNADL